MERYAMKSQNLNEIIKAEEDKIGYEVHDVIYKIKANDAVDILQDLMKKGEEYININFVLYPDLKYPVWKKYFKNSIENSIEIINSYFIDAPGLYKISSLDGDKRKFEIYLRRLCYIDLPVIRNLFEFKQRMYIIYEL